MQQDVVGEDGDLEEKKPTTHRCLEATDECLETCLRRYHSDARQLAAAADHGDGHQLPSDVPAPQELQGALRRGPFEGRLLC